MEQQIFPVYGIIYRLRNKLNGKVYIGQTTKFMDRRIRIHLDSDLPKYKDRKFKFYIHRAVRKHGRANFEVFQLCECYSREDLNWAEKFYIQEFYDSWNSTKGYNISGGGEFGDTLSHHPNRDEIGKRISATLKERGTHRGSKNCRYGISLEVQMIEKHGEIEGKKKYDRWKEHHSLTMKGSSNRWYRTNIYKIWEEKYGKEKADQMKKDKVSRISEKLRNQPPEINAKKSCPGSKNGMYGVSVYDKWVEKYGKEEADRKEKSKIDKMIETKKRNKMEKLNDTCRH